MFVIFNLILNFKYYGLLKLLINEIIKFKFLFKKLFIMNSLLIIPKEITFANIALNNTSSSSFMVKNTTN